MNTYIPINALEPTPDMEQIFMIEEASQRYTGNKKPFVSLKLRDVTGYIYCYIWNTKLSDAFEIGKFVLIKGKIETYGDNLQINVRNWQRFGGVPDNLSDYIHCPNPNVIKAYLEELDGFIDSIEDPEYRDIIQNARERLELPKRISESPYGFDGYLAYRGGLLMYSVYLLRAVTNLLDSFKDTRNDLNRDLLILGCIFRNLGWWVASLPRGNIFVPGEIAHYLGVRFASAMVTNHACLNTESDMRTKIDLTKKIKLQQIAFADKHTPNLIPEAKLILQAESVINDMEFTI